MTDRHALGRLGEAMAAAYLDACGYAVVDRRWRRPGGELDLVVARGRFVVFVEVKTRGPGALDRPEAALAPAQRHRLRQLARRWLAEHPGAAAEGCRCDVVAVSHAGEGRGCVLRHFADAF
ncbi:MAG TPA: YraN family protein [Candidatus Krumholzibacteria bacterium]|nr:YraN family protein [Candidatus Krumholzibacteria bacterium]